MADATGEGPLYLGKIEGCMFKQPNLNESKIFLGSMIPYAATTATSAPQLFKFLRSVSDLKFSG